MRLRELYKADEVFYWGRTGSRPTVIETKCVLKAEVDAVLLKSAFSSALMVHTNFRVRPVICRGRVKALLHDIEKVPVFPDDGCPKHIGSCETEGYMLYCSYRSRCFTLHVFHGVSDLRGIINFMNTMLLFYFGEEGQSITAESLPYATDTELVYETIMEKKESFRPEGRYAAGERSIFHIPEPRFQAKNTAQRLFEIDIPAGPLLRLSKSCESSVFPVIQTMTGRGLRKVYDVGDADIAGYGSVDLRPIFKVSSGGNSASAFTVPYTPDLEALDFGECAKLLRKEMLTQIKPDNLFAGISQNVEPIEKLSAIPHSIVFASGLSVAASRRRDDRNNTYGLSYGGHVSFGQSIDRNVESVSACAGSYSYPVWMVACEFGGMIRIMVSQAFGSDAAVRGIFSEIKEHIPEAVLTDHGMHGYDECHVKDLEHIKMRKNSSSFR